MHKVDSHQPVPFVLGEANLQIQEYDQIHLQVRM